MLSEAKDLCILFFITEPANCFSGTFCVGRLRNRPNL